jgi:chitinase
MLSGYLQNYRGGPAPLLTLQRVDPCWGEVCIAFADVDSAGRVSMDTSILGSIDSLARSIEMRRSHSKSTSIAIGGANAVLHLHNKAEQTSFVRSTAILVLNAGFDGIDFDLESGVTCNEYLSEAILELTTSYGIPITLTPEWPAVQGGFISNTGYWGSQLKLIDQVRDVLSCVRIQYYNNCPITTPYKSSPSSDTIVRQIINGSRMLLDGFPCVDRTIGWFRALKPYQIGIALPACEGAAKAGYLCNLERRGLIHEISTLLNQPVNDVQVACWSINWDLLTARRFSRMFL